MFGARRSLLRELAVVAVMATVSVACAGGEQQVESAGNAKKACQGPADIEQKDITFIADWLPWAASGPMWAAQQNGYYEDEGLRVRIQAPAAGADPPRVVAAGRAEFAISDAPVVIEARDEGIPLVSVGAPLRELASGLIYDPQTGIESVQDLKGGVLGINPGAESEAFTDTLLKSAGMTEDDVKIIDPGFGAVRLVLARKVVAAYAFVFYEGSLFTLQTGREPGFFLWTDYGVPNLYHQIIVASEPWLAEHPCTAKAFMRATAKGLLDFLEDPKQVTPLMAEENEVVPLEAQNQMAEDVRYNWRDEVTDEHGVFYQAEEKWAPGQEWMLDSGLIDEQVEPSEYYTNDYLDTSIKTSPSE